MGALHRFLVEFDAPYCDGPVSSPTTDPVEATAAVAAAAATDRIADAVAVALAEARAEHAARLGALERRFIERLADERASWAHQEGASLAAALRRACDEVGAQVADAAAAVLEPFVGEAVRSKAIAELGQAVASLVHGGSGSAIAISGPEDLVGALRDGLAALGIDTSRMSFAVAEAADVTVTADSSTIRTRLGEWSRAFGRRTGGDT